MIGGTQVMPEEVTETLGFDAVFLNTIILALYIAGRRRW